MKSIFRCVENYHYSLNSKKCRLCNSKIIHPSPARFSLIKEFSDILISSFLGNELSFGLKNNR